MKRFVLFISTVLGLSVGVGAAQTVIGPGPVTIDGQAGPSQHINDQAPIPSTVPNWMGQPTYPVPGLTLIPSGHLVVQGTSRGWGASANIFQVFANNPQGTAPCGGGMSCYTNPANRGYDGQDVAAANIFANSRLPLATDLKLRAPPAPAYENITVTMPNGASAPATLLFLSSPLSPAQYNAVVPLMKVETTGTGNSIYYGYTIPTGVTWLNGGTSQVPLPPINITSVTIGRTSYPPGTILVVDGMYNGPTRMSTTPAGLNIDTNHQVDAVYFGTDIQPGDLVGSMIGMEGVIANDQTTRIAYSGYDPKSDVPDIMGISIGVNGNNSTSVGNGGSAFLVDSGNSINGPNNPGAAVWKRGLACRNMASANNGAGSTTCVWNAFATVGLYSVAPTTGFDGNTDYVFQATPNDLGRTTASLTQAGAAQFTNLFVTNGSTLNGAFNVNGASALAGPVFVSGNATVGANEIVDGNLTVQGATRISDLELTGDTSQTNMSGAWTQVTGGAVTAASGSITSASSKVRYKKFGRTVFFDASVTITTNGSGAVAVKLAMPFPNNSSIPTSFGGRETAIHGYGLNATLPAGSSNLMIEKYDGSYPGGNGVMLNFSGSYEADG